MRCPAKALAVAIVAPTVLAPCAVEGVRPAASISTVRLFGHTEYTITFPFVDERQVSYLGESRLEFPLDVWMGGGNVSIRGEGWEPAWSLGCAVRRNLSHPHDPMTDRDWLTELPTDTRWLYSSTESGAELTAWFVEADLRARLLHRGPAVLAGRLGYRYTRLSYDIRGLDGWLNEGTGPRPYPHVDDEVQVLTYRVSHHLPLVGMAIEVRSAHGLEAEVGARFSPHAYANDLDDHVLRFKTAESTCTGTAYIFDLRAHVPLPSSRVPAGMFVELRAEWGRVDTDGDQSQRWYGDDPVSEENDTGGSISGIDSRIEAEMASVSLWWGWGL